MDLLFGIIIIFIAALLQGMTSFGASLIALPLLIFFYDIKVVVPFLVTYNLIMNAIIFKKLYKHQNIREILPMLISGLIFTVIGIVYFKNINSGYITIVVGFILILLSIVKLFGIKFTFKNPRIVYVPVGMVSGFLNGIAGLSGPPLLIFLSAQDVEKNKFRATLTSYFLLLNIFTVVSFMVTGSYTLEVFNKLMTFLPALLIGLILGIYLGNKVNENLFKKLILIFLGGMGIYMVYNGLF